MRRSAIRRGTNSLQLRRYNERLVLQTLRRAGEASKAELARQAELTNTAIGGIIAQLEADGLIASLGKRHDGGRGQPATLYRLAPQGAFGIGVRLDRRSMESVLIDFGGSVIARRSHDGLLPAPAEALRIARQDVAELLDVLSPTDRPKLAGIGLAQPYNLGAWLHQLDLPLADFAAWDVADFPAMLEEATGLPVFGENDGTAAAVAELFYGIGRSIDDFLYLFIGPAIGGGVVLGGDCLRGPTGNAGDVAMLPVGPGRLASAPAPADGRDILLTRASLNALSRHLAFHGLPGGSRADLTAAIAGGQPPVAEWIGDCVDAMTDAIWSASALLEIRSVIIDADIDDGLIDALIGRLQSRLAATVPEAGQPPRLLHGTFGCDAGAIGAASLPMFFSFSPRASILTRSADERGWRDHAAAAD
ncbi:ROK family transcriptional regulator [Inquilinus sp.]|uniref:ROK family transcriptional regulator n=1 Tax=Inquilinus sp. TaxID=1932117 RepID=UPI0031D05439